MGCGPFKLVEWVPSDHFIMDRFERYFKAEQPYVDRVQIRVIKDPVTQMAALKAGEIDFIASFSPEHVEALRAQNPDARILTGPETTPMMATMKITNPAPGEPRGSKKRTPHPIFGDIRVRKAVACYPFTPDSPGVLGRGWIGVERNALTCLCVVLQCTA